MLPSAESGPSLHNRKLIKNGGEVGMAGSKIQHIRHLAESAGAKSVSFLRPPLITKMNNKKEEIQDQKTSDP